MKSGSLRRRKNGTWQYRASYGTRPDGTPNMRSASFPAKLTQTQAEAAARKVRNQWDREHERGVEHRQTLGYLVDEWEKVRERSPNTDARYVSILRAIRADLGHIRLTDLTARHLDQWYRDLGRPTRTIKRTGEVRPLRTPNTIHQYYRVVRGILAQGVDWGMIDINVATRSRPPKQVESDQAQYAPTIEALTVMLAKASKRATLGVLLSAATGCREGEVVALRWTDLQGSMLRVERSAYKVPGKPVGVKPPKNRKIKRIPLPPLLLERLAEHRVWQADQAERLQPGVVVADDAYILAKHEADPTCRTPFAPAWLAQEWERMRIRAGVSFKFHGLRHMHGSLLVDAGVSPAAAAERQGHSLAVFQARYAHALAGADQAAAEAIGELTAPLFAVRPQNGEQRPA